MDIDRIMEDPKFSKRVSKSPADVCTLCIRDLLNDTNQYQLQCPKDTCSYYLCHLCMRRVFSFKYVRFYSCFICNAEYQLTDAAQMLKDRLASLDDVNLRRSFEELIRALPNQFKPETIRMKKQQQQEINAMKGIQTIIAACIMDPSMSEEAAEELAQGIPNIDEVFKGQVNESDAVEEPQSQLSSTCTPASNPSTSISVEQESRTSSNVIWTFISNVSSYVWNNIKCFTRSVGNLIARLCTSFCRFLRHCPAPLQAKLQQQLDATKRHFEHSHTE